MKYIDRLYEYEKEKRELEVLEPSEYEEKIKEIATAVECMSLVSSFIENPKNYVPLTTESKSKPDADIYIRTCKVCGKKFSCTNPKEWVGVS